MPEQEPPIGTAVVDQVPKVFRLESIKSRIVGLALLATLIPSLAMAWISYVQNRAALTDRIDEELQSVGAQAAREVDLWFKERLYDVRVFASSYLVSENIERALQVDGGGQAGALDDYLTSVGERFPDYNELIVVDHQGERLATSAERAGKVHLTSDWLDRVAAGQAVIGDAYFDEGFGEPLMTVAVPVTAADQTFVGAFVANVTYRAVRSILLVFAPGNSGNLYVIAPDGTTILSLRTDTRPFAERKLTPATTQLLFSSEGSPVTYADFSGNEVLGTLRRVASLDWAVVAEIPAEEAYAQVEQLRDVTALLVMGLLVVVGFIAYGLGLLIVRPLDRLTTGAAEVAAGDLAVDLPVGRGEVGYLTEVFNGMVDRLREGRQQLEELLVTDPLTGVSNRRDLMEKLRNETRRSRRSKKPFSILMSDVDSFKEFNDTHGHVAGDEALKAVAKVLQEGMRKIDYVARYGGEEFLVILPHTGIAGAVKVAERIRKQLAELSLTVGERSITLTVSTGVAEFPIDGDSPESLIVSADAALYQAKDRGRDRVARASRGRRTTAATSTKKPTATTTKTTGAKSKPTGTAKKTAGTTRKPTGTTKKSAGTKKKLAGTTKKPAGTTKKSAGTTKKSAGTTKKSAGTTKKSAGTTKKSAKKDES
jgi:diguanylate cyclase (GGDEF)-like protein